VKDIGSDASKETRDTVATFEEAIPLVLPLPGEATPKRNRNKGETTNSILQQAAQDTRSGER
jgi:hypothetical protein